MESPNRKSIRLKDYDYSQNGAYFITLCIHNNECILGNVIVGEGFHALPNINSFHALPHIILSTIGKEIEKSIRYTNEKSYTYDNHISRSGQA